MKSITEQTPAINMPIDANDYINRLGIGEHELMRLGCLFLLDKGESISAAAAASGASLSEAKHIAGVGYGPSPEGGMRAGIARQGALSKVVSLAQETCMSPSEAELAVQLAGRHDSRRALEAYYAELEPKHAPACPKCGKKMGNRGKSRLQIVTVNGLIEIKPTRYRCANCHETAYPLVDLIGLVEGDIGEGGKSARVKITIEAARVVSYYSASLGSFEQAQEALRNQGIPVGATQAQRVAGLFAEALESLDGGQGQKAAEGEAQQDEAGRESNAVCGWMLELRKKGEKELAETINFAVLRKEATEKAVQAKKDAAIAAQKEKAEAAQAAIAAQLAAEAGDIEATLAAEASKAAYITLKKAELSQLSYSEASKLSQMSVGTPKSQYKGKIVLVMYILADGVMVPGRPKELAGSRGRSGGPAKTFEAKIGAVFTVECTEDGRPLLAENGEMIRHNAKYIGTVLSSEELGPMLHKLAKERGIDRCAGVVFVSDGAHWIWAIKEKYFPNAVGVVDLFHSIEHALEAARLAKAKKGKGSEEAQRKALAEKCACLLKRGMVNEMIGLLESHGPKKGNEEAFAAEVGFFRNNIDRMNYGELTAIGAFVGSGVIESACKSVVSMRLKGPGMTWLKASAGNIIDLRCAIKNKEFFPDRSGLEKLVDGIAA